MNETKRFANIDPSLADNRVHRLARPGRMMLRALPLDETAVALEKPDPAGTAVHGGNARDGRGRRRGRHRKTHNAGLSNAKGRQRHPAGPVSGLAATTLRLRRSHLSGGFAERDLSVWNFRAATE
jgi:hypothetical protein